MSCSHSLKMWQPSALYPHLSYKKLVKVSSSGTFRIPLEFDFEGDFPVFTSSMDGKIEKSGFIRPSTGEFAPVYDIGCGHCYDCRMQYALNWANRLMLEKRTFPDHCWFLTLTYDDENLKPSKNFPGIFTLSKKDTQDFHKRLRFALYGSDGPPDGVPGYRFFLAGEYGDHTFRPHYHEISYNLPIQSMKLYSHGDYDIYQSEWLDKIWSHGKVWIEEVTPASCAYVARYVEKKQMKDDVWLYEDAGIQPEFTLMSRNPGICGFSANLIRNYSGEVKTRLSVPGGKLVNLPKYCDKFLSDSELAEVKRFRQWRSEEILRSVLENTSCSEKAYKALSQKKSKKIRQST